MYWIVTDSATDLPKSYIDAQEQFQVLPITITLEGQTLVPDGTDEYARNIYAQLRAGKVVTTAQINSETWKENYEALLKNGQDVLSIVFSSGLSGTCQAAMLAAQELREKYPERQLIVIDSLCASMGEGLLVHHALQNRAAGMSLEDNAAWVRDNVQHLAHWFTVDDLMFLLRGGRVSAASAYLGTMMRIKPILNVDEEGHLMPREKVQGRKRSIHHLLDKMKEHVVDPEHQVIFISHGDCADEANHLAELVRETFHPKEILVGYIGPVIGAHAGPGTVALFFLADQRD